MSYTISYSNGILFGTSLSSQEKNEGESITIHTHLPNVPSMCVEYYPEPGYFEEGTQTEYFYDPKFLSWNTDINGNGQTYMPGDVYDLDSDLTLYAQWELPTIQIIWDQPILNDGSGGIHYGWATIDNPGKIAYLPGQFPITLQHDMPLYAVYSTSVQPSIYKYSKTNGWQKILKPHVYTQGVWADKSIK